MNLSTAPRTMTRREWRQAGYFIKRRQEPIYRVWTPEARYYSNEWHAGMVGIYSQDQCETVEQYWAARAQREASKAATEAEWAMLSGMSVLKTLKAAARRLYTFLHGKAKAAGTDTIITDNTEILAACRIKRNHLKRHRDTLVSLGLIRHRLTKGRQSLVTVNALSRVVTVSE